MSFPHCVEPLPLPTPTAALGTLRARGLRISTTRRLVRRRAVRRRGSRHRRGARAQHAAPTSASVYRNLEALEAAGIARHVHLGHAAGRYVLSGRHDGGYAACERCGKHVPLDDLEALRARRPRRSAASRATSRTSRSSAPARTARRSDDRLRFEPVEHSTTPSPASSRARRCSSRSASPSCSGCATRPTPTT